jgi:hypothetical protein
MALTLIDKLKSIKMSEFSFTSFEKKVTADRESGEKMIYLIFDLEQPITKVIGTNGEYDPDSGQRVKPIVTDVVSVQCALNVIEASEADFTFDEDAEGKLVGSGKYAGDLILDIARSGQVWLTNEPFSKKSQDWKASKKSERIKNMLDKWAK